MTLTFKELHLIQAAVQRADAALCLAVSCSHDETVMEKVFAARAATLKLSNYIEDRIGEAAEALAASIEDTASVQEAVASDAVDPVPASGAHRWSGWPGAWCLDCGAEDQTGLCMCECPDVWPSGPDGNPEKVGPCEKHDIGPCPCPGEARFDPYRSKT